MTRAEAAEKDSKGQLFVEEDEGMYCVFGSESGFCYASFMDEGDALEWARDAQPTANVFFTLCSTGFFADWPMPAVEGRVPLCDENDVSDAFLEGSSCAQTHFTPADEFNHCREKFVRSSPCFLFFESYSRTCRTSLERSDEV